ncbi:MAG: tellurite resistance/C4-dicarboxylate transporter family protein [Candidatus Nanopelagicales bacterium]|nr:tellurite resistance/C4-dicarboxylate transporter family protein [Candidatus Nanopelagicales bacterium]
MTQAAVETTLGGRASNSIRTLNPGYFALVMATGIVSVGLHNNGWDVASVALLWVSAIAYAVLVVLYLVRLIKFRKEMVADFVNPATSFAFFTIVAGTNVLGTRIAIDGHLNVAMVFLVFSTIAWIFLGYGIPWASFFGPAKRPLLKPANGTWLIWTVATQSVAVLAATLEPHFELIRRELAILAVCCWAIGLGIYVIVIITLHIRLMTVEPDPKDFTTPYWISMGALAITILAGGKITEMASAPMVNATRDMVSAGSVLCWAVGTWLIPPILAVGYWRHFRHKVPLNYQAPLWSMVFPLGMYAVSSDTIGQAVDLPVVQGVGYWELWIAFIVWIVVFFGMLKNLTKTVVLQPRVK